MKMLAVLTRVNSVVQQSDIIFAALVQFQPVTRLLVSVTWCIVPLLLGQRSAE